MTIKKAKKRLQTVVLGVTGALGGSAAGSIRRCVMDFLQSCDLLRDSAPPPPLPPPCCVPRYVAPPELLLRYLGAESTRRSTAEHSVSRKIQNETTESDGSGISPQYSSTHDVAWVSSRLDAFFFFYGQQIKF